MSTMPHSEPGGNAPQPECIATLIPRTTSHDRLLRLRERYANPDDPVVAATPNHYQQAIRARLRDLLNTLPPPVVAR